MGVVKRGEAGKQDYIYGWQIKSPRWLVPGNCLMVSKINARQGAIGWVPTEYANSLTT